MWSIQNFCRETSWGTITWKTERRCENNIQVDLREIDFEDERWVLEHVISDVETLGSAEVVLVILTRSRMFVLYLHI